MEILKTVFSHAGIYQINIYGLDLIGCIKILDMVKNPMVK